MTSVWSLSSFFCRVKSLSIPLAAYNTSTSQKLNYLLFFNLTVPWFCQPSLIYFLLSYFSHLFVKLSAFVLYYKLHELFVSKPAKRTQH